MAGGWRNDTNKMAMKRILVEKNRNYTTISNVFLKDKNLSLKAKGLLAFILSLPDNWDFSVSGLIPFLKEGRDSIFKAVEELKKYNYCHTEQTKKNGKFDKVKYIFSETPHTGFPHTENPYTENPYTENPQQINTNIISTNIINTKEKKENIKRKSDLDFFEQCWVAYKRKGSKKDSYAQWVKLSEKEKQQVKTHIPHYVGSREIQYQKAFERYLGKGEYKTIVVGKNNVIFDPSRCDSAGYNPSESPILHFMGGDIGWLYTDFSTDVIYDGYNDDNRPDGAKVTLNNARGVKIWNATTKRWITQ